MASIRRQGLKMNETVSCVEAICRLMKNNFRAYLMVDEYYTLGYIFGEDEVDKSLAYVKDHFIRNGKFNG
jgi:hypothetical protein